MRELKYMPRIFGDLLYPGGFPLYFGNDRWAGNVKEMIEKAVSKYYNLDVKGRENMTEQEKELLFEYVVYHINAPIWDKNPHGDKTALKNLRRQADQINSIKSLEDYISHALGFGLDPL